MRGRRTGRSAQTDQDSLAVSRERHSGPIDSVVAVDRMAEHHFEGGTVQQDQPHTPIVDYGVVLHETHKPTVRSSGQPLDGRCGSHVASAVVERIRPLACLGKPGHREQCR